jgi:hypothetical protein
MSDFESWWCDLSGYVFVNMSICLTVYDMDKFAKYFEQGLSFEDAAKKHYAGL